jgi:hypothetical protein
VSLLPKAPKGAPSARCNVCGGYHPGGGNPNTPHLEYVGHAEIMDRLDEVDPDWTYTVQRDIPETIMLKWLDTGASPEAIAILAEQYPFKIVNGSITGTLTVLGRTVICVGDAQEKRGPNALKEMIGDLLRNGAMRLGIGRYLWSRSDRAKAKAAAGHGLTDEEAAEAEARQRHQEELRRESDAVWQRRDARKQENRSRPAAARPAQATPRQTPASERPAQAAPATRQPTSRQQPRATQPATAPAAAGTTRAMTEDDVALVAEIVGKSLAISTRPAFVQLWNGLPGGAHLIDITLFMNGQHSGAVQVMRELGFEDESITLGAWVVAAGKSVAELGGMTLAEVIEQNERN